MSKRKFEGCLIIDHRESPGLTPEQVQGRGPVVGKGQLFESATSTCVHCQAIVILNPLRTRPRHYCAKCDDFICDACAAFPCVPFAKVMDAVQEAGATGKPVPILGGRIL
jgi:hypothetical protein